MFNPKILCVVSACLLCACSKSAPNDAASPSKNAATQPPAALAASVCDKKLVTAQDVASLFSEPVVNMKNIPGDPQSCAFKTAGFSGASISVRPGKGIAVLSTYTSGHMSEYDKSEPLAGVGDEAIRSLNLNRIVARKGDLLCEITGPGLARPSGDPMIANLSGLCEKIFAAQAY